MVVLSGCNSSETNTSQQPKVTPTKIAEQWVKALIKGTGSEEVFNYLHSDVQSYYNSYDQWNDELANMKYSWNSQGLYFEYIGVENEIVTNDNATVEVKYRSKGILQKTTTQKYEFLKVNNEWKLKEYYELQI
ncbi:hypothetical protein HYW21_02360 [Candidatus Woesearchaeota archaeon]|nr:hypothetical protein [Candidatus Woesearchaeota archaeon]